jgi:hypothetical protein
MPLVLAAALLAPTPLWRLATVPVAICIAVPLTASFFIFQPSPQLRLEPPPNIGIILVEGTLAASTRHLATAIHGR